MAQIKYKKKVRTVGELRAYINKLPDYLLLDGIDGHEFELFINDFEEKAPPGDSAFEPGPAYYDELELAKGQGRNPDFRYLGIHDTAYEPF